MKLTLRDLFWLVLVMGMGCALWVDWYRIRTYEDDLKSQKITFTHEQETLAVDKVNLERARLKYEFARERYRQLFDKAN